MSTPHILVVSDALHTNSRPSCCESVTCMYLFVKPLVWGMTHKKPSKNWEPCPGPSLVLFQIGLFLCEIISIFEIFWSTLTCSVVCDLTYKKPSKNWTTSLISNTIPKRLVLMWNCLDFLKILVCTVKDGSWYARESTHTRRAHFSQYWDWSLPSLMWSADTLNLVILVNQ